MVPHSVIGLCSETNKQSSSRLVIPPTATHAESTELAANKHTETTKKGGGRETLKEKLKEPPASLMVGDQFGHVVVFAQRLMVAMGRGTEKGGGQLHRKDADGDIIAL